MEDKKRARDLRVEGLSYSEIANIIGRHRTTICDWVRDIQQSDEQKKFLLGNRRKPELQERARELRRSGKSVKGIAKEIGAAPSSVSVWVRDIELTEQQRVDLFIGSQVRLPDGTINRDAANRLGDFNRQRRIERWEVARREAEAEWPSLSSEPDFMLGLGLYIGEGYKQSEWSLGISNCDPAVMRVGLRFFERIGVPKDAFVPNIQLPGALEGRSSEALVFWSSETGIDIGRFKKTMVDTRRGNGKSDRNPWPNGCCHVKVHNTILKQKLLRWMELAVEARGQHS